MLCRHVNSEWIDGLICALFDLHGMVRIFLMGEKISFHLVILRARHGAMCFSSSPQKLKTTSSPKAAKCSVSTKKQVSGALGIFWFILDRARVKFGTQSWWSIDVKAGIGGTCAPVSFSQWFGKMHFPF